LRSLPATLLSVDENGSIAKLNFKTTRSTLILRDVAKETTEEVRAVRAFYPVYFGLLFLLPIGLTIFALSFSFFLCLSGRSRSV
jgi:hypothetical protein